MDSSLLFGKKNHVKNYVKDINILNYIPKMKIFTMFEELWLYWDGEMPRELFWEIGKILLFQVLGIGSRRCVIYLFFEKVIFFATPVQYMTKWYNILWKIGNKNNYYLLLRFSRKWEVSLLSFANKPEAQTRTSSKLQNYSLILLAGKAKIVIANFPVQKASPLEEGTSAVLLSINILLPLCT